MLNINRSKTDFHQPLRSATTPGANLPSGAGGRIGGANTSDRNMIVSNSNTSLSGVSNNSNSGAIQKKSAVGEIKRLKVQFIQANVSTQNVNLSFQINPKTWPNLGINELIEISSNAPASSAIATNSYMNSSSNNTNSMLVTNSLNRGVSSSLLSSSTISNSSGTVQVSGGGPVTGSASNTSAAAQDDDTSPFLVHVAQTSFIESIASDTICIDRAATSAPFSIKPLSYVWATVVERDVSLSS